MTGVQKQQVTARFRTEFRALVAAVTFLTRIPVGRGLVLNGDDVARAGPAFPLVGAGLGAAVGGIAAALAERLTPLLAVAVAVAVGTTLTGAMHLDALADTADALGAHSRERALEIMRDHAIGTYGASALALDLLIKTSALAVLAAHAHVLRVAIAAGALSRAFPVLLAAYLPYARPGEGTGVSLTQGKRSRAVVAAVFALGITAAAAGIDGLIAGVCAAVVALFLGFALNRWLKGVTGDTLGAVAELTEATVLVVAVALLRTR